MENCSPDNESAFVVGQTVLHTSPAGRQTERVYLGISQVRNFHT